MQVTTWTKSFEEYAEQLLAEANAPGAAIGVARGGKLLYQKTFGYRDRENGLPLSADTVFGIASITKSFTCVAIMQLQEAGKLSVHDPVVKYLPELRAGDEELTKRITIHHFMTHTPGMAPLPFLDKAMKRSMEQDPAIAGTEAEEELKKLPYLDTYEEVLQAIAAFDAKPLGEPGEVFSYNNDAYGLLGAIIERVSGQTYEQYVTKHILQPLGMQRTVFDVEALADKDDVTILYTNKKLDGENQVIAAPHWHDAPAMRAAGFLKSTVNDLLAYLEVFRTNGEGVAPMYTYAPYELADEQLSEYAGRYESNEWLNTVIAKRDGQLYLEVDGLVYPLLPVAKDSFIFRRRDSIVWIDFFRDREGEVARMSYALRQLTKASVNNGSSEQQ